MARKRKERSEVYVLNESKEGQVVNKRMKRVREREERVTQRKERRVRKEGKDHRKEEVELEDEYKQKR